MSEAKFPLEEREWKGLHAHRKRPFAIEYRARPEKARSGFLFESSRNWRIHSRYETKQARHQALRDLNRKDTLFEYRKAADKSRSSNK
jgi:hypothetical protein